MICGQVQEVASVQGKVAPGFQQAKGQVLGGAQAIGENLQEQTAVLHQLEDRAGQL